MKVTCEKCQTSYNVAEARVPLHGARANCPNCGGVILILGAPPLPAAENPVSAAPAAEKDFGKTISFDFSQISQGEDDAARMLAEAKGSRGFLQQGFSYALRDAQTGEIHPVPAPEFVIGRSDAGIDIHDPEISRRHCEVKIMGDHLILIDLGSTNGTHVRGERVKTARLTPGQSFTIGNTTLEFRASRQG
jgi:predicted Zn finger-like uncharacterized protein